MQYVCQHLSKSGIADSRRSDQVHRSLQVLMFHHMQNCPDDIGNMNPTPPLPPASNFAAKAQPESRQHLRKRATLAAEDQAEAGVHRTNSRRFRGAGRLFPLLTDLRQEIVPGRALLAQDLVATGAVVADSRGADKNLRALRRFG